jgi:exodeoxyribonuclease VII small subunit
MAKQSTNFDYREKAAALEAVALQLQDPDIQIDEATKLHAAGLKLISELEAYLRQAEVEVKKHVSQ